MTNNSDDLLFPSDPEAVEAKSAAPKKRTRKKISTVPKADDNSPEKPQSPSPMAAAEEKSPGEQALPAVPAPIEHTENQDLLEEVSAEEELASASTKVTPHTQPAHSSSLLSGLLPIGNAGSGIITLSRSNSGVMPVQLPPPKASIDKKHTPSPAAPNSASAQRSQAQPSSAQNPASSGQRSPRQSNNNKEMRSNGSPYSSMSNRRSGGTNGGSKFVRDDAAFVEAEMDDAEMDAVYEPAYVDDVKRDITRPRLDRYELTKASPEILARMGQELGGLIATPETTLDEFVNAIIERNNATDGMNELTFGSGVVVRTKESGEFGILRSSEVNYVGTTADIYLTPLYMKRYGLRIGDAVLGTIKRREKDGMYALMKVYAINGIAPEQRRGLRPFETLVPYYPTQRILMENDEKNYSMRVMDIITPIGRGQRGLIVAPPRTGKTVMLQNMANSIIANNDDITLIVMLIDERPEEVTDMREQVNAEVVASTFDEPPEKHKELMELVMERSKRLVENGRHVVILLDSITRLARAYNTLAPKSGRILSGGLDANALFNPKRFFGSARNIQGGGSLTILATALIDTGSRMDELIFEEFKGTGNMELHLDRSLADRRIFPAIDCLKSGTRREELIVDPDELEQMWSVRRILTRYDTVNAMDKILKSLRQHASNALFLHKIMELKAANAARQAHVQTSPQGAASAPVNDDMPNEYQF